MKWFITNCVCFRAICKLRMLHFHPASKLWLTMFTATGLSSGYTQVQGNTHICCWNLSVPFIRATKAHRWISIHFVGIILVANKCQVHLVTRSKMLRPLPHGYECLVFIFCLEFNCLSRCHWWENVIIKLFVQGVDYLKYDNCYTDGSKPMDR